MSDFEHLEEPKRILDAIKKEHIPVEETRGTDLDVHASGIEDKCPSTLTRVSEMDNVTVAFEKWGAELRDAVFSHDFEEGYLNMNAFEDTMTAAFNEVCAGIDKAYGAGKKAEGVRMKKDILQAFMREMKDLYEHDRSDLRVAIAKGYAEKFAQQYIHEEHLYTDDRERKTETRAVPERAQEVVKDFFAMVEGIPEGLQAEQLGISETELDARVKDFLSEKMAQENKGILREVLLYIKRMLESMNIQQDPDGRWGLAGMAIDTWCDVYFTDIHFIEDDDEDEEEEDDNWWRR